MNKLNRKIFRLIRFAGLVLILFIDIMMLCNYFGNIKVQSYLFTESTKELKNPRRGFYNIYKFMITDEETDYRKQIPTLYAKDENTKLTLVEINLQNYRSRKISKTGMANIRSLLQTLGDLDRQLIIRFLYDWDGENEKYEPETIDVILGHMEQMEDVLEEFGDQIFVLQGLFVGNWGELNGTKYGNEDDLVCLAQKLDDIAKPSIYLAVRTPAQWRNITGVQEISEGALKNYPLAGRISLFNDGMFGNESDYGTYNIQDDKKDRFSGREEELAFQDQLCQWVPNGGEVINDNFYNDFENAVRDLSKMHVTYLNEGYDQAVLEKWKEAEVTEDGIYKGMDGYTYIERHLGYRLLIEDADLSYESVARNLRIGVTIKNVGFAPMYTKPEIRLVLYDIKEETYRLYEMEGNLCQLPGGDEADKRITLVTDISREDLRLTEYEVYFYITDSSTRERILLANEQEAGKYGYCIGNIKVDNWFSKG